MVANRYSDLNDNVKISFDERYSIFDNENSNLVICKEIYLNIYVFLLKFSSVLKTCMDREA